jgi:hypothetical protein
LRFAGLISTLKSACIAFAYRLEWIERQNNEISQSGTK